MAHSKKNVQLLYSTLHMAKIYIHCIYTSVTAVPVEKSVKVFYIQNVCRNFPINRSICCTLNNVCTQHTCSPGTARSNRQHVHTRTAHKYKQFHRSQNTQMLHTRTHICLFKGHIGHFLHQVPDLCFFIIRFAQNEICQHLGGRTF